MRGFSNDFSNDFSAEYKSFEAGAILPVVALAAFLLVLLSIGYSIDFPTTQASAIRTQSALDIGGAHGLQSYYNYSGAANSAFANADSVLRADYASSAAGMFSAGFANWNRNKHSLWIPTWNSSNSSGTLTDLLSSFQSYRCESATPQSCAPFSLEDLREGLDTSVDLTEPIRKALASVYDLGSGSGRINDFKNAITFYTHIRPYRYLPILPLAETEIVSTVRLKNTMTTVIVDPAFSMGDDNYQRLFGAMTGQSTGATDELMWPFAAFRRVNGSSIIYPLSSNADSTSGWVLQGDYFSFDGNLFKKNPITGESLTALGLPAGDRAKKIDEIFKFYAATCDSSPFFLYKGAVVNLLDRLTNSSAFNSTTSVVLTGYSHDPGHRLIPIYPANVQSGSLVAFDFSYPLPLNPGGASEEHNRYLHLKKPAAFTGYMNSRVPSVSTATPAGFNRWDLAYCRGLYGSSHLVSSVANTAGFVLPEDRTASTENELNHTSPNKRRRDTALGNNWVDDESAGPSDFDISMTASQNDAGGETPRNIVANLAIRPLDPKIERVTTDVTSWTPPDTLAMGTGFRYLPDSLAGACENLNTAVSNYNTPGTLYSALRPVEQEAVVAFAFGLFNTQALETRNGSPLSNPGTEDQAFDDFRNSLKGCLCGKPQRKIFLAMLPMDRLDRNQTVKAIDVVKTFSDAKTEICAAQQPAADPCAGAPMGSIYTFVYDWEDSRFATLPSGVPTSSISPGTTESDRDLRKLLAAEAFSKEVYDYINRLLIEYAYST